MADLALRVSDDGFASTLGARIREARLLAGWTQEELAERANTAQAVISRLELGKAAVLDLVVIGAVCRALGVTAELGLTGRHLQDRRRQVDPVHARLTGFVAGRLRAAGWAVATEVAIGEPEPRGWIDLLATRERDGAGILGEMKGDFPDIGGLQRQVGFYTANATRAAMSLGWRIERLRTVVVALDSRTVEQRIASNREFLHQSYPGKCATLLDWIGHEGAEVPTGPTLVLADPFTRRTRWCRTAFPTGRRPAPAYADYAEAAARVTTRRRPRGPPGRRRRSWRSPLR